MKPWTTEWCNFKETEAIEKNRTKILGKKIKLITWMGGSFNGLTKDWEFIGLGILEGSVRAPACNMKNKTTNMHTNIYHFLGGLTIYDSSKLSFYQFATRLQIICHRKGINPLIKASRELASLTSLKFTGQHIDVRAKRKTVEF